MRQWLYDLKHESLSVTQFKLKFDEHIVYFSNWGESDRFKFLVHNLKDSIRFKVSAHSPKTLDKPYGLAMNFKREVNSKIVAHLSMRSAQNTMGTRAPQSNIWDLWRCWWEGPSDPSVRVPGIGNAFYPQRLRITRVRPWAMRRLWCVNYRMFKNTLIRGES